MLAGDKLIFLIFVPGLGSDVSGNWAHVVCILVKEDQRSTHLIRHLDFGVRNREGQRSCLALERRGTTHIMCAPEEDVKSFYKRLMSLRQRQESIGETATGLH